MKKTSFRFLMFVLLLIPHVAYSSVILNWQSLGGAGDFYGGGSAPNPFPPSTISGPLPTFASIDVGPLLSISTSGKYILDVNTFNSIVYVYVSATIDDMIQTIAWTDVIEAARGSVVSLQFTHFAEISGAVTNLHIGESLSAGRFVQVNDGDGTNFIFTSPVNTIPEPSIIYMILVGLGIIVYKLTKNPVNILRHDM